MLAVDRLVNREVYSRGILKFWLLNSEYLNSNKKQLWLLPGKGAKMKVPSPVLRQPPGGKTKRVSPCKEGENVMPLVQVEMLEGRNLEQKRAMVKEVTEVLVKTINCKAEDVQVIIREMKRENFAVGGALFVDN